MPAPIHAPSDNISRTNPRKNANRHDSSIMPMTEASNRLRWVVIMGCHYAGGLVLFLVEIWPYWEMFTGLGQGGASARIHRPAHPGACRNTCESRHSAIFPGLCLPRGNEDPAV